MSPVTSDPLLYFRPRFTGKCGRCGTVASGISWQNREEERNSQAVINTEGILWYLPVVTSVLEQSETLFTEISTKWCFGGVFFIPSTDVWQFHEFFPGTQIPLIFLPYVQGKVATLALVVSVRSLQNASNLGESLPQWLLPALPSSPLSPVLTP